MMEVVTADGGRFPLGTVETGASVGIIDYSRRVTDDFGVTTVVQRGFARRLSVRLAVPFDDVDGVQRRLADLRSTAGRWIADDRFAWLSPTGFYKDFDVDLAVPPLSYCTLTIEGLAENEAGADTGGDPAPEGYSSTLRLLQPFTVTDAVLTASDVAENDAPAWAAGTGYVVGAKVLRDHRVYEALVANTGNDPVATPAMWLDTGPTNRWAMFDQALGTVTTAQGRITVSLAIGGIAGVALLDVAGATVRVQADGYDRTQAVTGGTITFLDLVGRDRVTVTIVGAGAVSVGTLLIGRLVALGVTEASPTAGITDFSRKEVDDFGEVTIVKRGFSKRMTAKALIRADALDQVANRIAAVRAVPALWIGQDGLDSLTVYGFFKDFGIEAGETVSKLSLSIEGLSAAAKPAPIVDWEDVGDRNGTKPTNNADKTGDNVSRDTAAVGGLPAPQVRSELARIAPIAVDTAALKDAQKELDEAVDQLRARDGAAEEALAALRGIVLDGAATQRQLQRAEGQLSAAALQLVLMQENADRRMRDAGFIVDPATGKVYAYAIDTLGERQTKVEATLDAQAAQIALRATSAEVDDKILRAVLDPSQIAELEPLIARVAAVEAVYDALRAEVRTKAELVELTNAVARVTDAEQRISAAEGLISTKVEQTTFDQAVTRIGAAEQLLRSYGDVSSYSVELRQSRAARNQTDKALLASVIGEHQADERRFTAQALLRQELYTKIVDDVDGVKRAEARARLELALQVGALDARSIQDRLLTIEGDRLLAQDIDALGVRNEEQAAEIAGLQRASIANGVGIAGVEQTIRQQARTRAQTDAAVLGDIIAGDRAEARFITSLTEIHSQLTTTLIAGFEASAAARLALRSRIDLADARFDQEARTTADRFKAVTELIVALTAQYNDQASGLAATRSDLSNLQQVTAEASQTNARTIEQLKSVVNDPATGLPQTRAELAALSETVATQNAVAIRRLDTLEGRVNDPVTGLTATRVQFAQELELAAEANAATATKQAELFAQVNDPSTGLPWASGAIANLARVTNDRDNTNAALIQQVRTMLDGIGNVGIQQAFEAVINRLGKIEGTITLQIDVNGNVTGAQLIGGGEGPGSLNLINADLRLGEGRIVQSSDTFMKVEGSGFGVAKDLISWSGPKMAIDKCSRANGTRWEAIDGTTYYGGGLSVGLLRNPGQSSSLAADAVAEVPTFGSNGKPVKYVCSWFYYSEYTRDFQADNNGVQLFQQAVDSFGATSDDGGYVWFGTKNVERVNSTITLSRAFAGAEYVQLEQHGFTTEQTTFRGLKPTPGDAPGRATYTETIGGGFTVTDPVQSTANRALRLALARGFNLSEGVIQRLTIVAIEE